MPKESPGRFVGTEVNRELRGSKAPASSNHAVAGCQPPYKGMKSKSKHINISLKNICTYILPPINGCTQNSWSNCISWLAIIGSRIFQQGL